MLRILRFLIIVLDFGTQYYYLSIRHDFDVNIGSVYRIIHHTCSPSVYAMM